jgi:hypothetical protein
VGLVVGRETVLVTWMAIMVCLSAFAVWQATGASEHADEVAAQMRIAESERQIWESRLQASIDHDVQVLEKYCATKEARDAALYQLVGDNPNGAAVVPLELTLRSLPDVAVGGIPANACPAASSTSPSGDKDLLARSVDAMPLYPGDELATATDASRLRTDEIWLMVAGLLFAVGLFGLIGVDVLGDRGHRPAHLSGVGARRGQVAALTIAVTAFVGGLVVILRFGQLLIVLGTLVALAFLLTVQWRRRRSRPHDTTAATPRLALHHPHWWAEVLGAVTLVAFSAAALGLTSVSGEARKARTLADGQRTVAASLSQQGQLVATRDLNAVTELTALDAELAVGALRGDADASRAAADRRDYLEKLRTDLEQSARTQLATRRGPAAGVTGCPEALTGSQTSTRTLLDAVSADHQALVRHIYALQEATRACLVVSDETAAEADRWLSRASLFTVALVLLGLSGFLLTLAADPGRSVSMSNWLLRAGAAGSVLGMAIALAVPVQEMTQHTDPGGATLRAFGSDVAAGRTNGCDVSIFDRAIAREDGYGPAYAARAEARACQQTTMSVPGVLTSDLKPQAIAAFVSDLAKAVELGPSTSGAIGNLGWADILSGLHGGARARDRLEVGKELTDQAISMLEHGGVVSGQVIHQLRFNSALASAGLGMFDDAAEAYRHATECLTPDRCIGRGIADPVRRESMALWALADLELVADSDQVQRLREVIVSAFGRPEAGGGSMVGGELDVFPQEVQVLTEDTTTPPEVSIVWYFSPDGGRSWGVLEEASTATLLQGAHLNRPIAAGEALPAGKYRADVYRGGHRVASLESTIEVAQDFVRQRAPDVGVALATPADWEVRNYTAGTDLEVGPTDHAQGASVHRVADVHPDGDLETYLGKALDAWLAEKYGTAPTVAQNDSRDGDYFLGFTSPIVRDYVNPPLTAAVGFSSYTRNPWCGGDIVMMVVGGQGMDPAVQDAVFSSAAVDGAFPRVDEAGPEYDGASFNINLPDGWDGAARPVGAVGSDFQARNCDTGSTAYVDLRVADKTPLASLADGELAAYRDANEYPQFRVLDRHAVTVAGSTAAVEFVFTWRDATSGPQWRREIVATDAKEVLYLTFTASAAGATSQQADSDLFARTLRLHSG